MTFNAIEEIAWAKMPVEQRQRAVDILKEALTPEYLSEVALLVEEKGLGEWLPVYWHFSEGMSIRNILRREGFRDEELPTLEEYYDAPVSNWDDYYVQCVEAAAGKRAIDS